MHAAPVAFPRTILAPMPTPTTLWEGSETAANALNVALAGPVFKNARAAAAFAERMRSGIVARESLRVVGMVSRLPRQRDEAHRAPNRRRRGVPGRSRGR